MALYVGTDIGGTFTDIVSFDRSTNRLAFGKKLTNKEDLVEGVLSCVAETGLPLDEIAVLKHGTTQIINALLERRGARTAFVTTEGFKDTLEIGRAGRPVPFDLHYDREPALVRRNMCLEIAERIDSSGKVLKPVSQEGLAALAAEIEALGVDAVAVSFVNSYINDTHEHTVAAFLRQRFPDVYVTTGTEITREWFEYERASTAAANAFVGPLSAAYLTNFERRLSDGRFGGRFYMMGSNGGVLPADRARQQPIALIESGPIGGCIGASVYAKALGLDGVIAFDMGGTTAKCALVENGNFTIHGSYFVGGYDSGLPLRTPVLDIVEVGTGGGSIASLDGGRLQVGPRSAGSNPGPACFGLGGVEPTVTDANLTLGRISGDNFLKGALHLDVDKARASMSALGGKLGYEPQSSAETVASGIMALANVQMANAIKEITIERGRDAREFALFVFGGGGPLHGVELARELRIPRVIVPPEPGNFSALGMLFADARVDDAQNFIVSTQDLSAEDLRRRLSQMTARVLETLRADFDAAEVLFEYQAEMRFVGQKHPLRINFNDGDDGSAMRERFFDAYLGRYGHVARDAPVEIIGARVTGSAVTMRPEPEHLRVVEASERPQPRTTRDVYHAALRKRCPTPVYTRAKLPIGFELTGPAIIEEYGSTTVIGPNDLLKVGLYGELSVTLA